MADHGQDLVKADTPSPHRDKIQFMAIIERETTNTVRFEELVPPGGQPAVGYLYVRKKALALLGNPGTITITITREEPNEQS